MTAEEMTALWKKRLGFDESRTDCEAVRCDGPDIDALVLEDAKAWYSKALRDMPLCCLPMTEISPLPTAAASPEGAARFVLPEGVVRIGAVSAPEWEKEAFIVTETGNHDADAQSNPFARAGLCRPVALVSDRRLTIYPAPENPETMTVMAVMEQDESGCFRVTGEMMAHAPMISIHPEKTK